MYVIGGHTVKKGEFNLIGNVCPDLYMFDFNSKQWSKSDLYRLPLTEHTSVEINGVIYILGGLRSFFSIRHYYDYSNTVYKMDTNNMEEGLQLIHDAPWGKRSTLTATVYDNNKIIIFGGSNGRIDKELYFNDCWLFDTSNNEWTELSPLDNNNNNNENKNVNIPVSRCYHLAGIYKEELYIYGGYTGSVYLNDMWKFTIKTRKWTNISKLCKNVPPPRSRSACVVKDNIMFVLSGWYRKGYYQDFYSFDFETYIWKRIDTGKFKTPNLSQHSMVLKDDIIYIYGGFNADNMQESDQFLFCKLQYNTL